MLATRFLSKRKFTAIIIKFTQYHKLYNVGSIPTVATISRDGAEVARESHNLKVGGSNPSPTTIAPMGELD